MRRRRALALTLLGCATAGVVTLGLMLALAADQPGKPPPLAPSAKLPPAPAPVLLTQLGGCAYNPAFADDDTVVFDLTRDGAVDLYRLELGSDAAPVRLTSDPGWEWRAARGATGDEVVFLTQNERGTSIETLELTTGTRRVLTRDSGPAVFARDSYFYAPASGGTLRRRRGSRDEVFLTLPPGRSVDTMDAPRDGARLGLLVFADRAPPQLCTVELDRPALVCADAQPDGGRPAFSSTGSTVYVDGIDGIDRVTVATGEVEPGVLASVLAPGGIAVAPAGRSLVYSECQARTSLYSIDPGPDRLVIDDGMVSNPAFGPGGALAYVRSTRERRVVMLRAADGTLRELVSREKVAFTDLAFSPDGRSLAYVQGSASDAGIYLVSIHSDVPPNRLTEDPSDIGPVFAEGGIVFTRRAPGGGPQLMRVALDGSDATVASPRPRITVGADPDHHRVLVAAPGHQFLYWWDPRTGRETPGPPVPANTDLIDLSLSPDGSWLLFVAGGSGQAIWRLPITGDGRKATPEHVEQLADDLSSVGGAIDVRGHPLISVDRWAGELWIVTAPNDVPW